MSAPSAGPVGPSPRRVPSVLDRRWVLVATLVVVALPFLLTFLRMATTSLDAPRNHDVALIELRAGDVLGGDLPLVGSYERYGGNQPGPWLFWVLAVPSRLGPLGIGAATLVVGYGAIAAMLWVADRRGGPVLVLWTALLSTLVILGRGLDRLADPWEPMITVLLLALLVMLVWEVASGTVGALPGAVALTWFLASVWTMLTPAAVCVGAVLVAAVVARGRDALGSGDRSQRRRFLLAVGAGVAVLAVMVAPTVLEQLTRDPGNLTRLREAAASSTGTVGLSGAWSALRLQFGLWAPWLGRTLPVTLSSEVDGSRSPVVPVALVAWVASMAALVVVTRRRRRPTPRIDPTADGGPATGTELAPVVPAPVPGHEPGSSWWLHAGTAAVLVGLLVGLSLSRGGVAVWSMAPSAALAMLLWLVTGWTVAVLVLGNRPPRWSSRTTMALAASVVVAVVATSVAALRSDQGPDLLPAAVGRLADGVPSVVSPGSGPVLVTSDAVVSQVFDSGDFGVAELAARLRRDGYRAVVRSDLVDKFGRRRARPGDAAEELRIESGSAVPDGAGWSLVARVDPLDAVQRRRRDRLDREIEAAADGADGAALLRRAAGDPHLAELLRESATVPDEPRLSLWYRLRGRCDPAGPAPCR